MAHTFIFYYYITFPSCILFLTMTSIILSNVFLEIDCIVYNIAEYHLTLWWHGTSVYTGYLRGAVILIPVANGETV